MANINRDYIIKYSPKNSKIQTDNMFFYTSDLNTTNVFIVIVGDYQDNLQLEVIIIPPKATTRDDVIKLQAKKLDDKLYIFEAPNYIEGTYQCEIRCITSNDRLNTSQSFTYRVKANLIK